DTPESVRKQHLECLQVDRCADIHFGACSGRGIHSCRRSRRIRQRRCHGNIHAQIGRGGEGDRRSDGQTRGGCNVGQRLQSVRWKNLRPQLQSHGQGVQQRPPSNRPLLVHQGSRIRVFSLQFQKSKQRLDFGEFHFQG